MTSSSLQSRVGIILDCADATCASGVTTPGITGKCCSLLAISYGTVVEAPGARSLLLNENSLDDVGRIEVARESGGERSKDSFEPRKPSTGLPVDMVLAPRRSLGGRSV